MRERENRPFRVANNFEVQMVDDGVFHEPQKALAVLRFRLRSYADITVFIYAIWGAANNLFLCGDVVQVNQVIFVHFSNPIR